MPLGKSFIGDSNIITTLHYMIRDAAMGLFPDAVDVRYFATITQDMRFTFWVCRFAAILKKACVY